MEQLDRERTSADAAARRRRRLAPGDRRAELVEAAIRTLRSDTTPANWVAAVTNEAGAAKGTFYVYFPSWEHMLAAVRQRILWEASEPLRAALGSDAGVDWWAVLERECERFVAVAVEFRTHHGLIFHADLPLESDSPLPSGPALLRAAIDRGSEQGAFRATDAEAAAALLFAAMHAATDAVLAGGEPARWIGVCLELAHGFLGPAPEVRDRR